jgi:hypothetical protein
VTPGALRKSSTCLVAISLVLLSLPSAAPAAPTITALELEAVPIPGFSGTGNFLGAGAAIEGKVKLSGTEYGGFPSPLVGIDFYAPAGAKLHPRGFATCSPSVIEQSGPERCPKRAVAGPVGHAVGVVSFGGERVPETASVQPFFAPGDKLVVFVDGTTPALLEILATGHVVSSSPPFGVEFIGEVPLIETVPEAPDASFVEGAVEIGAAYKQGKKTVSYITLPKSCPKHGWSTKAEFHFLGGATAEASYSMPCPTRR